MTSPVIQFLGCLPVPVLRGLSRGAWWSVYPHSSYWRLGANDPDVESALRRHACRPGFVCWDIGAHHGIYAVGLARAVGPDGRVEAFEPDPVSQGRLRWHRRINRLGNLHIHTVAASNRNGVARLYQYDGFGSTTSHLPYPGETLDHVPSRDIETARLDDWVENGLIRAPDFIKIDIEGHAFPALDGMRRTVTTSLPVILLAIHTDEERDGCGELLKGLGYTLEPVSPHAARRIEQDSFGELVCLPPSDNDR